MKDEAIRLRKKKQELATEVTEAAPEGIVVKSTREEDVILVKVFFMFTDCIV